MSLLDELVFETKEPEDKRSLSSSYKFYFNIGSVDSFEKQLEDTQKQLGIPITEYVPVKYTTQWSLVQEALR